jgi:NifU-like protein involved in Fe-S cluster formation
VRYNEITRRYFESSPCAGMLMGNGVHRGASGDRERGTWVQFDVQAATAITAARFLCFGCPHTIAISAWVADTAAGRPLIPALPEDVRTLSARFELPAEKLGRLLVIEDAWVAVLRAAIANGP